MKKKALVVALAGAMISPSAFAAQDTSGMRYTSAAEGFYVSLRTRFTTGSNGNEGANIGNSASRFGVRGTNDLGGGLEGFYQYEAGVNIDNGGALSTRLGHVGVRGTFGQVIAGTYWGNPYNWVYGTTDVANHYSGNLVYNDRLPARFSRSLEYTTPNLNGFQGAVHVTADNRRDGTGNIDGTNPKDDNTVDQWGLAAKYEIQGFSLAGTYLVNPDAVAETLTTREDFSSWALKAGFAQDNWYINGWYSVDNASDASGVTSDNEIFSVAGGVSVDKVSLYGVYESLDRADNTGDDSHTTIGLQYDLGSKSRVWLEYAGRDLDSVTDEDDFVSIGLRHDF